MTNWADDATSDPVGDLRAMAAYLVKQRGSDPTRFFMSSSTYERLLRWQVWYDETLERLYQTPRWRWVTRMALKRQLWGGALRRSRIHRRIVYRITEWKYRNDPDW